MFLCQIELVVYAILVLGLFSDPSFGATTVKPSVKSLDEAIQATEKRIEEVVQDQNTPSLVFGIAVRGKAVHKSAHGWLDVENKVPASTYALYRIASMTKSFTSALIGSLVDQGKLAYEDSIYAHLNPDVFPKKTWKNATVDIKVGHLLSHMAGLHVTVDDDVGILSFPRNSTESLKLFASENLRFDPGTSWEYSNFGFQVLGAIIENVTNQDYPKVMNEYVKNILRLNATHIEQSEEEIGAYPRAHFYRPSHTNRSKNILNGVWDEAFFSIGLGAAGAMVSNVDELLEYGNRLLDVYHGRPNPVVSNATLTQMWTPRTLNTKFHGATHDYCYGWSVEHIPASPKYSQKHPYYMFHFGALSGSRSFIAIYPKEEIVTTALVNKGQVVRLDEICEFAVENMYDFIAK